DVADASSLCGACAEACPVKIPLHDMLVALRRRKVEAGRAKRPEALAMRAYAAVMGSAGRLKGALRLGRLAVKPIARDGFIRARIGPLAGWTRHRVFPAPAAEPFRERWTGLRLELEREPAAMDPAVRRRLEEALRRRQAEKREGGDERHGG